MADIAQHIQPTVSAIYAWYESKRESAHRPHLGASIIGDSCDRKLWYTFRWTDSPSFDGRMLRLFDYGWKAEDRFVAELRGAGITVLETDPETGRQWTFSALGGHFGCSLDGALVGLHERPDRWHSVEMKTSNAKNFAKLKKEGVQKAQPKHYAQMIVGMELSGLDRAFYLAENKDTSELYSERVRSNPSEASRLLDRAERIIYTEEPLTRISDDPSWFECRFCTFADVCHRDKAPEVNCRTCAHATAERDGTWSCSRWGKALTVEEQRAGCEKHLFHPSFIETASGGVNRRAVESGGDWIRYDSGLVNGRDDTGAGYSSHEIRAADRIDLLPLPEPLERARVEMGGKIEEK